MKALKVLHAGMQTTIQDLGRPGFGNAGVPHSGAADAISARLANRLAGNTDNAAVIEITITGARFEVLANLAAAAAGASMPLTVNDNPLPLLETFFLRAGDLLAFGPAPRGARAYLAVAGGIDVPEILGSRSTQILPGFGGLDGRALAAGDTVSVFGSPSPAPLRWRGAAEDLLPPRTIIRTLPGPQAESFSAETRSRLYGSTFRISSRSNRAGLRLEGETIAAAEPPEIPPEGTRVGAIQIPSGGEPIILMPEGPVTGGYPKIATVICADLGFLGQLKPGDAIRLAEVSAAEAAAARQQREEIFEKIGPA